MSQPVSSTTETSPEVSFSTIITVCRQYQWLTHIAFSLCTLLVYYFPLWAWGKLHFPFMLWNLFLAWVPYGLSLIMILLWQWKYHKIALSLFLPWLLFFPNAPYMITDLMHLRYEASPVWFDTMFMMTFAIHGLGLGLSSLQMIHHNVLQPLSRWAQWLIVTIVLWLSGFAIYLGRFLEWNSWDIVQRPGKLFSDILNRIIHPVQYARAHQVTLVCFLIMMYAYILMTRQANPTTKQTTLDSTSE